MITANSVYKYMESEERIRIIEIDKENVYIVNIDKNMSMPKVEKMERLQEEIESNRLIIIKDPFFRVIEDKNLTQVQIKKRDADWNLINIYYDNNKLKLLEKSYRNKIFNMISEESNRSLATVKRLFSRYWQKGMSKNSLLPDYFKSGAKGKDRNLSKIKVGRHRNPNYYGEVVEGINITQDVKKHFEFAINKYYRNKKKISLNETYTLMLRDFYSDTNIENGEKVYVVWGKCKIPTYRQFTYWYSKTQNIKKDICLRESEKEYNLKHRVLLSNSKYETDGPGTRFQVDATIADIYLVSSLNRNRIIGRPIIYAIIDVYSRMITGVYVGLEGPSWTGAMMALDNMILDKVEYCNKHNIEIKEEQWPCKHLPEIIIADRGEFEGYSVENLINNLDIRIENTSPYRGDLKGIVERNFRTTNEKIKHKTPGAIQKEFRTRGDKDYRLDATLTLEEFTQIYINIVLHHNNKIIDKYPMEKEMIEDEIVPTPINLWNWGIKNRKGRLRVIDRETFRLNILPKGKAGISRAGIRFKGLYYSSDKAIREQWFIKPKVRNIEVVYDPRNMNKIYIPFNNGRDYDEFYLIDVSLQYKDSLLEEIIFQKELESELEKEFLKEKNQNNINLEKQIENIVKKSEKAKEKEFKYNKSSRQRIKGIKNNRFIEKELNREEEAFILGEESKKITKISEIIELPSFHQDKKKSTNSKLMEKIKNVRRNIYE